MKQYLMTLVNLEANAIVKTEIKSEKDLSDILNKGKNCGVVTLQDGKKYFFYKYAIEQTDNQTEEQKNNAAMAEQNIIDDFGKLL